MRRKIEDFRPYDFQADFSAPKPAPEPDTVTLPATELAALGAQLRGEAAAEARALIDAEALAGLETAIERLSGALADLSALAERLDALGRAGALPEDVARLADMAARRIADGQGDLFATCQSLAATVDPR